MVAPVVERMRQVATVRPTSGLSAGSSIHSMTRSLSATSRSLTSCGR